MKCILVATDFSTDADYTLKYVIELMNSAPELVRILLLNTYMVDLNTDPQNFVQLNDDLKSHSKLNLENQRLKAKEWVNNPNITIETSSHLGSLTNVINNVMMKEQVHLVALGKDGGNQIKQVSEVLKKQNCAILITHSK